VYNDSTISDRRDIFKCFNVYKYRYRTGPTDAICETQNSVLINRKTQGIRT